ncbi:MAG: hypothetical protein AB4041_14925 [Microcystaceae cyanobacterium]
MIRINWPSQLQVYLLSEADFKQLKKPLSRGIRVKIKENNFYLVNIPISFAIPLGYALHRLECTIEFCPEERNPKQRPVIYDLYPKSEIMKILDLSGSLKLGLDENLFFSSQLTNIAQESTEIVPQAEAKLITQIQSGINFLVNPINYQCYRKLIRATGKGNSKVSWQFDGKKSLLGQEVLLGLILMIPKTRSQPVDAMATVTVSYHFEWLTADILQDYGKRMKNNAPNPLKFDNKWNNITNLPFLNLHPLVNRLHDPNTGKLSFREIGGILGFSNKDMANLLNCTLQDLDNDNEQLQTQLFPIYLFIKNFFETIPTLNETQFRILLNVPTASFLPNPSLQSYKSLRIYLLERDFEKLSELMTIIEQLNSEF